MFRKLEFGRTGQRVESAQTQIRFNRRHLARRNSADRFGNRLDVRRRGAAATADDVEPAVLRPLAQLRREGFRCFGKTRRQQRIRQAGVRIRADVNRRDAGKFLDERTQFLGPERAVHADAQQRHVRNGIPKRLDGLAGHAAIAARLDERDGGENGNMLLRRTASRAVSQLSLPKRSRDSARRSCPALEAAQSRALQKFSGWRKMPPSRSACQKSFPPAANPRRRRATRGPVPNKPRPVHRKCSRAPPDCSRRSKWTTSLVVGPMAPATKQTRPGCACSACVRRAPGAFRAGLGQFIGQRFQAIIGQRNGLRIERVRLDDVRAGFEVLAMNVLDDVRPA